MFYGEVMAVRCYNRSGYVNKVQKCKVF